MEKRAKPLRIAGNLAHRLRYRKRRSPICFFSIQFCRLCHILLISRPLGRFPRCLSRAPPRQKLAGEEGFEPPHPVLETGGLPLNLLPCISEPRLEVRRAAPDLTREALFHFLMGRVLPASVAILLRFEPVRMFLPVLRGRVVAIFAFAALQCNDFSHGPLPYSMISVTAPAPTVCPPSRIAKRSPFSSATGVISEISADTLSPGITISTPCGSFTSPVTSVVRK
jgi:hypothetical protein